MCGIVGFAGCDFGDADLRRMADTIRHRGPDDDGYVLAGRAGLAARRLSIIDIAGGHQPMRSRDGRYAIAFNGEIYNYRELKETLAAHGHVFATNCDTETVLCAYQQYGEDCVTHLRGMFAFAILDCRTGALFLARDRVGVKPLYCRSDGGKLIFASEIKAILAAPGVSAEPDLAAIETWLSLRFVPGPRTLFAGIAALPPGHVARFADGALTLRRYWSVPCEASVRKPDRHYRETFAELFDDAVTSRLISEVPLGAYLSGGIDSTAVVATMARHATHPVQSFSVGFDWPGDEFEAARAVAKRLHCDHHEVVCRDEDFALLPRIIWHLDQPVGDAIVLPMFLLSRLARQKVGVVLTGDGADETMAGYVMHKMITRARRYARLVPRLVQDKVVQPLIANAPVAVLAQGFDYPGRLGNSGKKRLIDYLKLVQHGDLAQEYYSLIALFDEREKRALFARGFRRAAAAVPSKTLPAGASLDELLALQFDHWLPDDILLMQDKLTMANSVEGREPFLDHRLIEFLMTVPPHLKLNGATNKVLLRGHLDRLLPGGTAKRKKRPFYIPVDKFFGRGPLADMIATCLSEASVRKRGYFDVARVKAIGEMARAGEMLPGKQLVALTMLELWHRIFIDREPGWSIQ
jgi:asparagine synthase (glutamine-hydrolysing)